MLFFDDLELPKLMVAENPGMVLGNQLNRRNQLAAILLDLRFGFFRQHLRTE